MRVAALRKGQRTPLLHLLLLAVMAILVGLLASGCFGPGTFRVGVDIAPGTYRNSDSSGGCLWERLSGFGGTPEEIIANNFTFNPEVVTISPTDVGFTSRGCGVWTLVAPVAPAPTDMPPTPQPTKPQPTRTPRAEPTEGPSRTFGEGLVRIGIDIEPGMYRNSDSSYGCYYELLTGLSGADEDVRVWGFTYDPMDLMIGFTSDVGFYSSNCGTWTWHSSCWLCPY